MMSTQEEAVTAAKSEKQAPPARQDGNGGKAQKARATQQNNAPAAAQNQAGQCGREVERRFLSESEEKLLEQQLAEIMKNPRRKRELFNALRRPGARFISFNNELANRFFRVNQDLDRVMHHLERRSSLQVGELDKKHAFERDICAMLGSLVNKVAEIAVHVGNADKLISDASVREVVRTLDATVKSAQTQNEKVAAAA